MKFLVVLALFLGSMHGSKAELLNNIILPTIDAIIKQSPNSIFFDILGLNFFADLGDTLFGDDSKIFSKLLNTVVKLEPEVTMDMNERVAYNGYKNDVHNITTKDGYILRADRILNASAPFNSTALPLIVIPGTMCESDLWIANNKANNLPFLMADIGRDVWLLSLRGSKNSPGHVTMTIDDPEYWKFSFDEMAKYDLPAAIDYILEVTDKKQLYVTGYSLGGGAPILTLAELPEYNQKVKAVFALSPLGNLKDFDGPARALLNHEPLLEMFGKVASFYKLHIPLNKRLLGTIVTVIKPLIHLPLVKWASFHSELYNMDRYPNFVAAAITTTSWQLLMHYGQFLIYDSRKGLRKFDFGSAMNRIKYGSAEPPVYNLKKVSARVHLYYGTIDNAITKANVAYHKDRLPNVAEFTGIPDYDHSDFIIATSVAELVYNPMIKIMIHDN